MPSLARAEVDGIFIDNRFIAVQIVDIGYDATVVQKPVLSATAQISKG